MRNVQKVRSLFDAFYAADEPAMSVLIGEDFVTHAPGGSTGNSEGWKSMAQQLASALPDNHTEIHNIIGEGDMVAVRYTSRGTHCGTLFGVPPYEQVAHDRRHRDVPPRRRADRGVLGPVRHE